MTAGGQLALLGFEHGATARTAPVAGMADPAGDYLSGRARGDLARSAASSTAPLGESGVAYLLGFEAAALGRGPDGDAVFPPGRLRAAYAAGYALGHMRRRGLLAAAGVNAA